MVEIIHSIIASLLATYTIFDRPSRGRPSEPHQPPVMVSGATGGVQPRLELHQLQQNPDQWNVYLLALQSFQTMEPSDPMSWYSICGIHGFPHVSWNDVPRCHNCTDAGYCTHSSTLFPTWHRTYGVLFEQSLQNNALIVANQFPGEARIRYLEAAAKLRMPYWDWGLKLQDGEDPFPQIFKDVQVSVITPNGERNISNPLWRYNFGTADHSFMETCSTHDANSTYRNVTLTRQSRQNLRNDLWTMFTSNQNYTSFSTNSLATLDDNYNPHSIEMIHDRVHVLIGGDMGFVPTAAYDPVFWLHHAMVDRVFVLWQALYPYEWVQPWSEVGHTYTYAKGTIENRTSPLTPFRSNSTCGFWTSDSVRDTAALGYEYAGLVSGRSAAEMINSLYRDNETVLHENTTNVTQTRQEYVASIQVDAMAVNGSFTVFLFDGEVGDEPLSWPNTSSLLGSHGFFSGPIMRNDGGTLVKGGVSLTRVLSRRVLEGSLKSLEDSPVRSYLKDSLELRVQSLNGTVMPTAEVPQLKVVIMGADVGMPGSGLGLPRLGEYQVLMEISKDEP